MLKLDVETPLSRKEFLIAGILTYVYNIESLAPFIEKCNQKHGLENIPLNVLYFVHHRGGDYSYTEAVANRVIRQLGDIPIIAVTLDLRNHGARLVDDTKNSSWNSGNETHALDMVSAIHGNMYDLKTIVDFLPSYLNLEPLKRDKDIDFKFNNCIAGYSLGGHTVIRFASKFPELVSIINPNVGCYDMSSLLLNRLKKTSNYDKKWFYSNYDELDLTEEEKRRYPEAFHKMISAEDIQIFENFDFNRIKMFASFYTDDPLVPSKISNLWTDLYINNNPSSEVYFEEGRLHDITPEMIDKFAQWLKKQL